MTRTRKYALTGAALIAMTGAGSVTALADEPAAGAPRSPESPDTSRPASR